MAWQKILAKQIDVTGTTANQILVSDGANSYWSNSSFITDAVVSGLNAANTNIANITANPVTFQSDVTIQGNVFVRGNALSFTSNTINFGDSLLSLAANNTISDIIDIGLYGHYYSGTANSHTGFFRSAVSKDWMLFTGYTIDLEGNNTINIADPSFGYANLRLNSANALSVYSNGVELRANDYVTWNYLNSNIVSISSYANTTFSTKSNAAELAAAIGSGGGGGSFSNGSSVSVTNISITGDLTSNSFSVNNSSVAITVPLVVSNSAGTSGYILSSNGASGSPYWRDTVRVNTQASASSISVDGTMFDMYIVTALASSLAFSASTSGTNGEKVMLRIKDNGVARSLSWASSATPGGFRPINLTLPTITVANKTLYFGLVYNNDSATAVWDVLAYTVEA